MNQEKYTLQFFDANLDSMGFYSEDDMGLVCFVSLLNNAKVLSYKDAMNYAELLIQHGCTRYKEISKINVCELVIIRAENKITYDRENLKQQIIDRKRMEIEQEIKKLNEELKKLSE